MTSPPPAAPSDSAAARPLTLRVVSAIREVAAADWDACANPSAGAATGEAPPPSNPFLSHAFLLAMEESKSATARAGWSPAHALVEEKDGTLIGCAPAYLKSHSQGEYVFDHGWADAFARAGGDYYPKVQVCVPFTPATGRRLLARSGPRAAAARAGLVAGLRALRDKADASSIHATFLPQDQWEELGAQGFLQRTDQQFQWLNEGYGDFDAFLGALNSRRRKIIKRERRDALANGITIERLTGADLTERVWDDFFAFYMDTGDRKWGRPYLTRAFYSMIGASMADSIILVMAKRDGRYVAGAINFLGSDALYGRHWGCVEQHPFLHFEVCYYQAIEEAIARGLARVEAGAQGEHKLARGYRAVTTYSAHDIAHPGLRRAIADYLARERQQIAAVHDEYEDAAPFRRDP